MSWSKEEEEHWHWMWRELPEFIKAKKDFEEAMDKFMSEADPLSPNYIADPEKRWKHADEN